jgi:hypothetical protein
MKKLLAVLALLLIALQGPAQEAGPNSLTAKEATEGWLLLFDGATTFGWTIDGSAAVADGTLVLGGNNQTTAEFTTAFGLCELRFQFDVRRCRGELTLNQFKQRIDQWHFLAKSDPWRQVIARVEPREISYVIPGEGQNSARLDRLAAPTRIRFTVPAGEKLVLRDIRLKPLGQQPIFNGKDLTGWKEHPGKKSKFAVVDGAINVKDGPGDLQTTGQWDDFILQLECISNGKHLNSGIFFRCIPDQYQQGYEAQVRNQFTAEPTQEYIIETYDPETGKVVKSEKIKSTAFDYGTGAIYRRMPARKAMSKDADWFTLTVAAHGRHFATWVNGVQVVDWTDTRPVKDNARAGCRLDKGAISIQGHDPTTDLSFRNIRIAELPAARK